MLFPILNIFFNLIIIVLLIRYFIEKYRYYGFGPIMMAVIRITEKMIKPIRQVFPQRSLWLQDQMPLAAIAVVLFIRGLIIFLLPGSLVYSLPVFPSGNIAGRFIAAESVSFTMGVLLISQLLIFMLFASMMITRRGITAAGSGGFMCFREKTFSIFQSVRRYIQTDNLVTLFIVTSLAICVAGAMLSVITSLSFMMSPVAVAMQHAFLKSMLEIIVGVLHIYMFMLLLAIVASWISADQFSLVVQFVRAMADPYLGFFRRLFPWARVDFIDLSPIFAFIALMIIIMALQSMMGVALL